MHRKFKHWYVKSVCAGKIPAKSALQTFVSFFKQFFFSFAQQWFHFLSRNRMLMTEGGRFENCESSTSLCGSFSPWLACDCFSISDFFFNLFPQWIKRTTNTSSADSVKFVNSDKLALSEIYKTPYPKSTRSIGVLGQNDLIQWKVVYSELCSL